MFLSLEHSLIKLIPCFFPATVVARDLHRMNIFTTKHLYHFAPPSASSGNLSFKLEAHTQISKMNRKIGNDQTSDKQILD